MVPKTSQTEIHFREIVLVFCYCERRACHAKIRKINWLEKPKQAVLKPKQCRTIVQEYFSVKIKVTVHLELPRFDIELNWLTVGSSSSGMISSPGASMNSYPTNGSMF